MRILLIADGRSPITKNWIHMLSGSSHQIILVSTYKTGPISDLEQQFFIPVGFSSFGGSQLKPSGQVRPPLKNKIVALLRPALMRLRAFITPLFIAGYQKRLLSIVEKIHPDIVHALRIPFEGMLAAKVPEKIPLIVSIWGNDLSLHAHASLFMAKRTRETLARADGIMADAASDIQLAARWGLRTKTPGVVVPGNGGLALNKMCKKSSQAVLKKYSLPATSPLVINSRGFRPGSVHQDVFFKSIPLILKEIPQAYFLCPGMQNQPRADKWVREYGIEDNVSLLPFLHQEELWEIFALAHVYVSFSSHDGTPNSFLEAIACGCFPVVGDIPSLQEWVESDKNGFLVDPCDAQAAADAVINALQDQQLRDRARVINWENISNCADIRQVKKTVEDFYAQIAG